MWKFLVSFVLFTLVSCQEDVKQPGFDTLEDWDKELHRQINKGQIGELKFEAPQTLNAVILFDKVSNPEGFNWKLNKFSVGPGTHNPVLNKFFLQDVINSAVRSGVVEWQDLDDGESVLVRFLRQDIGQFEAYDSKLKWHVPLFDDIKYVRGSVKYNEIPDGVHSHTFFVEIKPLNLIAENMGIENTLEYKAHRSWNMELRGLRTAIVYEGKSE